MNSNGPLLRRRRIVIVGRAIGRFEIKSIFQDKPFTLAAVETVQDEQPQSFQQAAQTSTAAMQLWQCMQQVSHLAGKLYEHTGPLGRLMPCRTQCSTAGRCKPDKRCYMWPWQDVQHL